MEYLDMIDSTVLTVSETNFKATRLHVVNTATKEAAAIDLNQGNLLKLINQLNEIIESHEIQTYSRSA